MVPMRSSIERDSSGLYRPPEGKVRKVKRTIARKRVYEFAPSELETVAEALAIAVNAARADIAALGGANAETLEPYIARKYRLETLQKRVFRKK